MYTDDHPSYRGLPNRQAVKHSVGQYVNRQVSTQGTDSFWSMVKRGYHGTFHHFSPKHLDRYVNEFAGRHNVRPQDTADQMAAVARGATGRRLRYQDLTAGGPAYPPEADCWPHPISRTIPSGPVITWTFCGTSIPSVWT